jgi:two-component system OmpR family response regulator
MVRAWNNELPNSTEQSPWHSRSPRLRVLIVDDNADAAASLAGLLQLDGHLVDLAYDGPSAVEVGLRQNPDVILLDLGLPLLDGWQVASTLLANVGREKTEKKPLIIAISGHGAEEDRKRSAEAGILVHFTKPANPETLLSLLRRFRSVIN